MYARTQNQLHVVRDGGPNITFERRYFDRPEVRALRTAQQVRAIYGDDSPQAYFVDRYPIFDNPARAWRVFREVLSGERLYTDEVLVDLIARGAGEDAPEYALAQTYTQLKPVVVTMIDDLVVQLLDASAERDRLARMLTRKARANRVRKAIGLTSDLARVLVRKDIAMNQVAVQRSEAAARADAAEAREARLQQQLVASAERIQALEHIVDAALKQFERVGRRGPLPTLINALLREQAERDRTRQQARQETEHGAEYELLRAMVDRAGYTRYSLLDAVKDLIARRGPAGQKDAPETNMPGEDLDRAIDAV